METQHFKDVYPDILVKKKVTFNCHVHFEGVKLIKNPKDHLMILGNSSSKPPFFRVSAVHFHIQMCFLVVKNQEAVQRLVRLAHLESSRGVMKISATKGFTNAMNLDKLVLKESGQHLVIY